LKKEAKTFVHKARALRQRARPIRRSFLVLFFKKELLVLYLMRVTLKADRNYTE